MGHITDAKSPITGNAINEALAGPNSATLRQTRAQMLVPIKTLRLSNSFSRPMPMKQPAVSNPQNHETAIAPAVCGS